MSDTEISAQSQQKIFNPWNPKNKNIPNEVIQQIFTTYGWSIDIQQPELFQLACVHKSYVDRSEVWEKKGDKMIMTERPAN